MFLHTNLRQREKFLCTTTDLQQRAIRANTTKTPPTTDMSIPTKNTVLEPWQFSVCVLYVCNSSSSSPSSSLSSLCSPSDVAGHRLRRHEWIICSFVIFLFCKTRIYTIAVYAVQEGGSIRYFRIRASHSMQTDRDGRQKQTRNREADISKRDIHLYMYIIIYVDNYNL